MMVRLLREGLGRIIVCLSWITQGRKMRRAVEAQAAVNASATALSLYQFYACPFCVKVRRKMHQLNVPIELRDAQKDPRHREALHNGGGRVKVPCLRIDNGTQTEWMYESSAIVTYLDQHFGKQVVASTAVDPLPIK
jgi:glutaredoxin